MCFGLPPRAFVFRPGHVDKRLRNALVGWTQDFRLTPPQEGLMLMISGPSHHFTARIVFDLCVLSICVPSVAEGKLVFIIEAYN